MYIKKLFMTFIILILIMPTICFADDVLEDSEIDSFIETSTTPTDTSSEPTTNSRHIVALDRKTQSILYEKDAYSEVPMASTTKIMTAILVLENCDLNESVEISKNAATVTGSTLGITTGSKMTMNDLLLRSYASFSVMIVQSLLLNICPVQ